jgi:formylglycine-generating enzyme required for sulfatase activity
MRFTCSVGGLFSYFYLMFFMTSGVFAQTPTPTPYPDSLFDHNQDGAINSQDLLLFLRKWGIDGIAAPTPTPTPTNPDAITIDLPGPSFRMVRIPAGSFMMGSPDTERSRLTNEGPVHEVTINYDFYLGETEVTQAQWTTVMGSNPAAGFSVGPDYPVHTVSWDDCQAFLTVLNALGQGTFRLPSEAEWEYACRAGTTTRFYFGDSLDCADNCENCLAAKGIILLPFRSNFMWYCSNSDSSQPVRQLFPNSLGLYDMAGNVSELCQDFYHADYTSAPIDGSAWESGAETERVRRGGDYLNDAVLCRSAARGGGGIDPTGRYLNEGFRVAWTP